MTTVEEKHNIFEKGDTMYCINQPGYFGSRCFETKEAAAIAAAIYDTLVLKGKVRNDEWELLTRATLRMIDSPSKW